MEPGPCKVDSAVDHVDVKLISWEPKGTPPMPPPPRNKALVRLYYGKPMVHSPLIWPYFLGGGGIGGAPFDCHDYSTRLGSKTPNGGLGSGNPPRNFLDDF